MMDQVLKPLLRNRVMTFLVVLQGAIACAIVCNLFFLAGLRFDRILRTSGAIENEIVYIQVQRASSQHRTVDYLENELGALRQLPGVKAVSSVNQVLYGGSSWSTSINLAPQQEAANLTASVYTGDRDFIETLGLRLTRGRAFTTEEYQDWDDYEASESYAPAIIVSSAVGEKLFGDSNPIGRSIYSWGNKPSQIVGVVDKLAQPNDNAGNSDGYDYSIIVPVRVDRGNYLLRTDSSNRGEVMRQAQERLSTLDGRGSALGAATLEELRRSYYGGERAAMYLLLIVLITLIYISVGGLAGLLGHWIAQRDSSTGIRRALGATRKDIARHYLCETAFLSLVGALFGVLLAYAFNALLMTAYELPRMPLAYGAIGMVALIVLAQFAAIGAVRRACQIDPALLARSL
ncbi:ABC transporter permease [Xanthomonas arboricola]|nr:ABC transporter permease [Xanthomonas arboricola]